jgi:hypothetical protein
MNFMRSFGKPIRTGWTVLGLCLVLAACSSSPVTPTSEQKLPSLTPAPPGDTPTPSSGTVTGRITYRSGTGEMLPDDRAQVELVANVGDYYVTTTTDGAGSYSFRGVPPERPLWIVASSPVGTSNPVEVSVRAGEFKSVDLQTFIGSPLILVRPAGGRVLADGQPVAGASAWPLDGGQVVHTGADGYFSLYYIAGTPVVAALGDRWTVVTLEPGEVIDVPLTQSGPHPASPEGLVVTPIPRADLQIQEPVVITRGHILMPTRPALQALTPVPILPTDTPGRILLPTRRILRGLTPVPVRPTAQ